MKELPSTRTESEDSWWLDLLGEAARANLILYRAGKLKGLPTPAEAADELSEPGMAQAGSNRRRLQEDA